MELETYKTGFCFGKTCSVAVFLAADITGSCTSVLNSVFCLSEMLLLKISNLLSLLLNSPIKSLSDFLSKLFWMESEVFCDFSSISVGRSKIVRRKMDQNLRKLGWTVVRYCEVQIIYKELEIRVNCATWEVVKILKLVWDRRFIR